MKKIFYAVTLLQILSLTAASQVTKIWEARMNGTYNGTDRIASMQLDANGNIISSSNSYNSLFYPDIITTKYNSAGILVWSAVYGAPGTSYEGVYSMKIDISGNVIIVGSKGGTFGTDILVLKYNSSGILQWSDSLNGPANNNDLAIDVVADDAGNIYVLGYSYVTSTNQDIVLMKYNASGDKLWVKYIDGGFSLNDRGSKISIAPNNSIAISGYSYTSISSFGVIVISTDTSGSLLWQYYNAGYCNITSMKLDNTGNIFVGGDKGSSVTASDYFILKVNSSGSFQWLNTYSTSVSGTERIQSMEVDSSGSIFATGYTYTASASFDITTLKYNSSGILQWLQSYNGVENNFDQGQDMDIDEFGNVFVTGISYESSTSYDVLTLRYNSSGVQQWVERYNGPAGTFDSGEKIKCLLDGSIVVGGRTTGIGTSEDITHIKYSDGSLPVTLSEFTGVINGRNITLNWQTSGEINNAGFDVQRQIIKENVSGNWENIAYVHGNGTTNQPVNYTFEDKNLNSGKYKYRLKQTDYNGNYEYFSLNDPGEIVIGNPGKYELSQNYPNPSNPKTKINFSVPFDSKISIKVYDMLGREAAVLLDGFVKAGYNSVEFDGSNLASGVYFYKIESVDFIETKKMILVK
ncbi:MAG: T9SS type A sorting domain-containing protein [Ignavibacteria bacterium]